MRAKAEAEKGDPDRFQDYFANLPAARCGTAKEVADVVTFLASDLASYVSGSGVFVFHEIGAIVLDPRSKSGHVPGQL